MSNDENKSLQQSLPLSWEEESQNNLEEEAPPKKLLLRHEPVQADDATEAPKPLLLKKSPEAEYRTQLDSLDTIYDKDIPSSSEEFEDEWEDEDEESFDELEDNELAELEDNDEDSQEKDEESFDELEDSELAELEDNDEDSQDEDEKSFDELEDSELAELEDNDEDSQDEDYESVFEDSGTFTLDEEPADSFEEDEIEEKRLKISAGSFSELGASESSVNINTDEEDDIEAEESGVIQEESVFALKADTYYEVQTEDKSTGSAALDEIDESQSVVVQHHEVKSLGALLQEARLSCSFTIKDAAESTRIKSSYIIALENNEMDELPAKVYVLNYIRQLCREYNVSNEPIIEAFERQSENNKSNGHVKIMRVGDEDARKATKPNSKLNALVVGTSLLTLVMLFLIGWYLKWFNPGTSPEDIKVDIKLEETRPEVKLPAPELPIPGQ